MTHGISDFYDLCLAKSAALRSPAGLSLSARRQYSEPPIGLSIASQQTFRVVSRQAGSENAVGTDQRQLDLERMGLIDLFHRNHDEGKDDADSLILRRQHGESKHLARYF